MDSNEPANRDGQPPTLQGWRQSIYLSLGVGFVGLAWLGALLPLLPTTPFLLLASFFFVRSAPNWQQYLLRSRLFGPFLRDWNTHHGVRPHVKIVAVVMVLAAVGSSLAWGGLATWGRVLLVALAAVGVGVILSLKTIREETPFGDE